MTAPRDVNPTDRLDDKTRALVGLTALLATSTCRSSYLDQVSRARSAGATDGQIIDVLVAVAPTLGMAHLVAATPSLALGLGVDLDGAFEGTIDAWR